MILSPAQAEKLAGEDPGIVGLRLGARNDDLVVSEVIADGPAGKAGVKPGDLIVAIDARPARGLSVESAQRSISGKVGALVVLEIQRDSTVLKLRLIRERRSAIDPIVKELRGKLDIREIPRGHFAGRSCPATRESCNLLQQAEQICVYTCRR